MTSPRERSGRLGLGVVGAGRVGAVLGAALAGAGHTVVGVSAVSEASKERAQVLLPGVPVLDAQSVVERSELVVLAVPDAELSALVLGLASTGAWQPGHLVVHTSPRFGTRILEPAAAAGAITLAVHPAMTFTGTSLDLARLAETYCAVTASPAMLPIGQALVVEMGGEPVVIAEEDREAYADAIVTASDFSRSIVERSTALLCNIGIDNPASYLSSLLRSTVDDALTRANHARADDHRGSLTDDLDV